MMIKLMNWVERRFTFDLPVGVYPAVVERVAGTPSRLAAKVAALPRELLTRRVGGGWSIQEHAGHLLDLEELHIGRLDDFLGDAEELRPADMSNRKTKEANHNGSVIEYILAEFIAERERFVERLRGFDERQIAIAKRHPRLGKPMRIIDNAWFCAEHDDHHLARMTEIAQELGQ